MHELIVPAQGTIEPNVKQVFGQDEKLDKKVRSWAQNLVNVLPKGLPLNSEEMDLLTLFLAQQHRLNLEIDASQNPGNSVADTIKAIIPFFKDDPRIDAGAHRIVSVRLERDINHSCQSFCRSRNIDPESSPATDWKVCVRFMAQSLHRIVSKTDLSKIDSDPVRFELGLEARVRSDSISEKRNTMLAR